MADDPCCETVDPETGPSPHLQIHLAQVGSGHLFFSPFPNTMHTCQVLTLTLTLSQTLTQIGRHRLLFSKDYAYLSGGWWGDQVQLRY